MEWLKLRQADHSIQFPTTPTSRLPLVMLSVECKFNYYQSLEVTFIVLCYLNISFLYSLSVVAQNVVLTISPEENHIVEVCHDAVEQLSNDVFQIRLGDLYAEG